MGERVFGVKKIWAPKILLIFSFVFGVALIFSLVNGTHLFSISIFSSLLCLRVLYEFLMSSFKSTEHLCRIADALDSTSAAKEE